MKKAMKKLRNSIAAKIVAVVLMALSLAASVCSAFAAGVLLTNTDIYSVDSWEKTGFVSEDVGNTVLKILGCDRSYTAGGTRYGTLEGLPSGSDLFDSEGQTAQRISAEFSAEHCLVSAAFYDENGVFLARNYELSDDVQQDAAELLYTLYVADIPEDGGLALNIARGKAEEGRGVSYSRLVSDADAPATFDEWLTDRYGRYVCDEEHDLYLFPGEADDVPPAPAPAPVSDADILAAYTEYPSVQRLSLLSEYEEYCADKNSGMHWVNECAPEKAHYSVVCCVNPALSAAADDYSEFFLARLAFKMRGAMIAIAIIGFILSVLLFAFLMSAAGWREGKDRPTGGFLERIPFGVWLAGCAALAFGTFLIIDEMDIGVNYLGETILIAFAAFALALEGIAMLVSFVARVKAGDFWKHTLCGLAVRGFGTLSKNWSTVWRVAVPTALLLGANGILALIIGAAQSELAFALMFILDVAAFVFIVREAIRWGRLTDTAAAIADGDSAARVSVEDMPAGLRKHGETINRLGDGVALAVERQMRSERMRTDLIANVSHDLKTPLTSIVNYVDLLKNRPVEDETAKEYIEVLDRQAARLKQLIEDLVEATKASNGCISAEIGTVGVGEILSQAVTEYESRLAKSGVEAVMSCPDSNLCAAADGSLLWRVFDNLLSNACKYAQEGTRLYIDARRSRNEAVISFRNTSREPLNITADELMERFVRGDKARTTEGSGLGLSIARSLTELMGGGFRLDIDGDLFKVIITLPVAEKPAEEMPALPAAEETTESSVEEA